MTGLGDRDDDPRDEAQDLETTEDAYEQDETAVEELDLDDDEPLPWLESSDYEEDEGVDTGRIVGFVILALLALGLLIGLFWFFTSRGPDPELAADGSTIAADDGPYKERPDEPGGKEFAGTGDVAPAVGEGQTREGRIADGAEQAPPTKAPTTAKPSVDAPSTSSSSGPSAAPGTVVQVSAIADRSRADEKWRELTRRSDALSGFKYRVEEARIDNGTVYRLQALAGDKAAARQLCAALKADGVDCIVK
ncbi:SPOR domain-containing protein [Qipengyuania sp. CAU 1752]